METTIKKARRYYHVARDGKNLTDSRRITAFHLACNYFDGATNILRMDNAILGVQLAIRDIAKEAVAR